MYSDFGSEFGTDGGAIRDSTVSNSGVVLSKDASPYKEIFCFSVCQPNQKNQTTTSSDELDGGFEMVFACQSHAETLAWVSAINSISGVGTVGSIGKHLQMYFCYYL